MAGWNWVYWCADTGCLASSRELLLCWCQSCWESACCSPHRHLSAAVLLMNDMQEVQEQLYLNKGVILLLLIILSGSCLISVRSSLQQLQTAIIKCSCPAWAHTGGLKTLRVRWRPEMDHFEVHWLVVIFLLSTNTVNLYFMEVRCNHSLGLHFYSKLQQFRAHTHTHTCARSSWGTLARTGNFIYTWGWLQRGSAACSLCHVGLLCSCCYAGAL